MNITGHCRAGTFAVVFLMGSLPSISFGMKLNEVDVDNSSSIRQAANYCNVVLQRLNGDWSVNRLRKDRDLCLRTFFCGAGECDAEYFFVTVQRKDLTKLYELISDLRINEFKNCNGDRVYENIKKWREHFYTYGFRDRLSGANLATYCGKIVPGYEIDTILKLRQRSFILLAVRSGGEAGLPTEPLDISESNFYFVRTSEGINFLRKIVEKSFERIFNIECTTNDKITCSVIASGGKVKIDLLVPGSRTTGRTNFWERSHWEVLPYSPNPNVYALSFNVPITSIKRWPVAGPKPEGGFQSLDFDRGFQNLRAAIMSEVAKSLR